MVQANTHRTTLTFDLRTVATQPIEVVAQSVADVLGCTFQEEEIEKIPSLAARVLGLKISLQPWSVHETRIFRLHGAIGDTRILQRIDGRAPSVTSIDISPYVMDLLTTHTDIEWYFPTRDDYLEESETARQLDEAY
jgi:hypothetical protein